MPENFEPEISLDDPLWEMLSAYSDGEASEFEQAEIERLLLSDPVIARELSFFQTTHQMLSSEEEVAPPAFLRNNILAATSQRPTLRRAIRMRLDALSQTTLPVWRRYALPVGSVAVIAGISYGVFSAQSLQRDSAISVAVAPKQAPDEIASLPAPPPAEPIFPQGIASVPAPDAAKDKKTSLGAVGANRRESSSRASNRVPTLRFSGVLQNASLTSPQSRKAARTEKTDVLHPVQPPREVADVRHEITPLPAPAEFTPKPMMDKTNQKPKDMVIMPAAFVLSESSAGGGATEATSATTPKVVSAELTPEQRRKARIEQARRLLQDANKASVRVSGEVSYYGNSDADSTKVVDNLKKLQSSSFVLRRF